MDAEIRLHLINERHAEARRTAAVERLVASIGAGHTKPPRGPLARVRRAAAAVAAAGAVLRAA